MFPSILKSTNDVDDDSVPDEPVPVGPAEGADHTPVVKSNLLPSPNRPNNTYFQMRNNISNVAIYLQLFFGQLFFDASISITFHLPHHVASPGLLDFKSLVSYNYDNRLKMSVLYIICIISCARCCLKSLNFIKCQPINHINDLHRLARQRAILIFA